MEDLLHVDRTVAVAMKVRQHELASRGVGRPRAVREIRIRVEAALMVTPPPPPHGPAAEKSKLCLDCHAGWRSAPHPIRNPPCRWTGPRHCGNEGQSLPRPGIYPPGVHATSSLSTDPGWRKRAAIRLTARIRLSDLSGRCPSRATSIMSLRTNRQPRRCTVTPHRVSDFGPVLEIIMSATTRSGPTQTRASNGLMPLRSSGAWAHLRFHG